METPGALTEQAVRDILRQIPDPELPTINLVDLGVIRKVEIGDSIRVELLPTFIGCPALDMMRREIMEKLAPYGAVEVKIIYSDAWTTDCISEAGREMLRQAKIVPPPGASHEPLAGHPQGDGPTLHETQRAARGDDVYSRATPCGWPASRAWPGGGERGNLIIPTRASRLIHRSHAPDATVAVACPYCGSSNTSQENLFGPTPCRAICYCHNCHQPFERFKSL
jgi:phenylacetate-CoA oxygenase PaaJ subunit